MRLTLPGACGAAALCCALSAAAATVVLHVPAPAQPAGCEAHVIDDRAHEEILPCGQPIALAGAHARGWIQTPTSITPFLTDVSSGGDFALVPSSPSGTISFQHGRELRAGERIRLISLVASGTDDRPQRLFLRDASSLTARLHLPAGRAIVLVLDEKDRILAVSHPVTITANSDVLVDPFVVDHDATTLVARLKRPRVIERRDQDQVSLAAADARGIRPPDAMIDAADELFAIWYRLSGTRGRLVVDSRELRAPRDAFDLTRGSVSMLDETLEFLPTLTLNVSALADDAARSLPKMSATVALASDDGNVLRMRPIQPARSYAFQFLPAALVTLDVNVGGFVIEQHVDLTSGRDTAVAIELKPILVSGTVYLGEAPARAQIRFEQKGEPLIVESDDSGAYQVTLWQARRYVIEALPAERASMPPFRENVTITSPERLDIHVPANMLSARVFDAADGTPIEHAQITIHNRWSDETGSHSNIASVVSVAGSTALPPQHAGTSEIRVHAAGYGDAGPISVTIDDATREKTIDVPLTRAADSTGVDIRLQNGEPAAGAEIAAWSADQMTWHDVADDRGHIAIPKNVIGSRLYVRHPNAASVVALLPPNDLEANAITLGAAAPPLVMKAQRKDGSGVGPAAARVTLWFGGVRVSGPAAGFMTWSLGATAPDGTFIARGLPAGAPLHVFVTLHAAPAQIESGGLDRLATTIPYPWPAVATITVADD